MLLQRQVDDAGEQRVALDPRLGAEHRIGMTEKRSVDRLGIARDLRPGAKRCRCEHDDTSEELVVFGPGFCS